MGTPLELVLEHFKDFKKWASDLALGIMPGDLTTFCQLEWPSFHVGWPNVGTFNPLVCYWVRQVIFGLLGQSDQVPYIMAWISLRRQASPVENVPLLAPPGQYFFPGKKANCGFHEPA